MIYLFLKNPVEYIKKHIKKKRAMLCGMFNIIPDQPYSKTLAVNKTIVLPYVPKITNKIIKNSKYNI